MLELRGTTDELLDEPLRLDVKGAPADSKLVWRARLRDDDGRVWRAEATRAQDLFGAWVPAKPPPGPVAALRSLRPLSIDVRAELPDGEAASRTVTRRLMGDGVRLRRWRDGVTATLHLPAGAPVATVVLDATAGADPAATVVLTAPLLASRGVLVLAVTAGLEEAAERLAAVPTATGGPARVLTATQMPPGVPTSAPDADPGARAAAWDALLAELGAVPRATGERA